MILRDPEQFLAELTGDRYPLRAPPSPRAVFLMSPEGFRVDPESALDNHYLDLAGADPGRALAQHRDLARTLQRLGIPTLVLPGDPATPDCVFPNNVFGTAPGRFIVGRMRHPGRQREAQRGDLRRIFGDLMGREVIDLSGEDCVAELTGPLIIDRGRGVGYCGMSERVNARGLERMHAAFGLRLCFAFDLVPGEYHTNVVMAILASRVLVLHPPSIADPAAQAALLRVWDGASLILDDAEKADFAGNCIAVSNEDVLFSARALAALGAAQRAQLERHGFRLHGVGLDEIEKAGGSLRCMIGEIF